jgi:hypothetical protein
MSVKIERIQLNAYTDSVSQLGNQAEDDYKFFLLFSLTNLWYNNNDNNNDKVYFSVSVHVSITTFLSVENISSISGGGGASPSCWFLINDFQYLVSSRICSLSWVEILN